MAESPFSPLTLTPGPIQPPDWVLDALRKRPLHQRSQAFRLFFDELRADLKYVFQTEGEVVIFPGSGTLGTEMAMKSVFAAGQKIVVQANGKFSERWARYGRSLGCEVIDWKAPLGHSLSMATLAGVLEGQIPDGFVFTHMETSTGALLDLEEMGLAIRKQFPDALLVVDAVSTVGSIPLYMDAWQLDVVVTASQKGFLNPVGLAIAAISPRAMARLQTESLDDGLHLATYAQAVSRIGYPFTPPIQGMYGLSAAVKWMVGRTLPAIWLGTHHAAWQFREGIQTLGFQLYTQPEAICDATTAFTLPGGDHVAIQQQWFGDYGLEVAGGQGDMAGQLLRMGHFGADPEADVQEALRRIRIWKEKRA